MFGLFKKKESEPEREKKPAGAAQDPAVREFALQFSPEEMEILAVTGPRGLAGQRLPGSELWTAGLEVTAWMEEDGPVHREEAELAVLGDDRLLDYFRRRVPRNFIVSVRVRRDNTGAPRFLMVNLPEPAFDPELKAIAEEQKKPVTFQAEGLGEFALNRSLGWFEAEVDWLGKPVRLEFDQDQEREPCLDHLRTLMAEQESWDQRVRALAADRLLLRSADWDAGAEEPAQPVTREGFLARLELDAVPVAADGALTFWFGDGEMLWPHAVRVTGHMETGPEDAGTEEA